MKRKQLIKGISIMVLVVFAMIISASSGTVDARDSVFTQKGSGPMYWTTYEYQQSHNTYMDETEFKKNIDWLYDSGLAAVGYNMVVTDGWGRSHTRVTANGYRTTHDDSWMHDYYYWEDYLAAKGMVLGVYTNPLWLTQAVMEDPDSRSKYKVIGTNIPVLDLLVTVQDGFNCVDVTKNGAEQYIKGYVQHFINMGVKYLRIDFLRNYENTMGSENYATALRWMDEAAGDDIELSLVMPNLYNHAATEVKYGDMVRIDDDAYLRGWPHISSFERGTWQPGWSQYGNAFDGFVGFADKNDKGNLILDGDFIRLNAYSNDEERKFAVSIFAMAGSPISFCDQYNSIGSGIFALQNAEINSLNQQGFAGKPFVFDIHNPLSQCWKGQLPNGDWVVGLFNREDTSQTRSINFAADLNMSGNGTVRDLWAHQDLGSMSSYSTALAPHSCKILKITGTTLPYSVKELEFGKMLGGAYVYVDEAASNTNAVGYIGQDSGVEVRSMAAGNRLTLRYATPSAAQLSIYVNGAHAANISLPATDGWHTYTNASVNVSIPLRATVKIVNDGVAAGDSAANLDKITVSNSGKVEAETGSMAGGAGIYSDQAASNGLGVGYIGTGASLAFSNVGACSSMTVRYACPSTGQLSLYINGVHRQDVSFPSSGGWTGAYANKAISVNIPAGANVMFKNDGSPDRAVNLDFVNFGDGGGAIQIALTNPGFETGNINGWNEWHPSGQTVRYGVDSVDVHSGNYKCYFWGTSSYKQSIHQVKTGLVNGSYTVKAWLKQNTGMPSICRMEVLNYGGANVYVNIPHGSSYNLYTATVNVTNGQIDIGFYTDSPGNSNMLIDDVELWKN